MTLRSALLTLGLLLLAPVGAGAEETASPCVKAQTRCEADCDRRLADRDAARAGCIARCATDRTVCEAEAGYNAAKPWLDQRMDDMKRFYEGFKGEKTPPPPPKAPSKPDTAPPRELDAAPNSI